MTAPRPARQPAEPSGITEASSGSSEPIPASPEAASQSLGPYRSSVEPSKHLKSLRWPLNKRNKGIRPSGPPESPPGPPEPPPGTPESPPGPSEPNT